MELRTYYPPEYQNPKLSDLRSTSIESKSLEVKGEPISKTWQPMDEARFLQNNPQISSEQADVYLRRSADNFLLEHSFETPFSFFVGQLAPDGHMDIQGTDMSASWIRTRERYGLGSDEDYETQGYEAAHEMLRGGAPGVIISSPQKQGVDRRFHFVLTKGLPFGQGQDYVANNEADGEWFTQINLMHKNDRLPFNSAKADYVALEQLLGQQDPYGESIQSNKDMLVRPILLMDTSKEVLDRVLSTVGIGEAEITRSYELQKIAANDSQLSEDMTSYINTVKKLSRFDLRNLGPIGTEVLKDAEALRNGIYLRANELYSRYKNKQTEDVTSSNDDIIARMTQQQRIAFWRNQKEPDVYGGLSCPRAADSGSIMEALQGGESMSNVADGIVLCKECPVCKAKNIKAKVHSGKIHCPECKAEAPYAC